MAPVLGGGQPTGTPVPAEVSPRSGSGCLQSAAAVPNISRGGQPVLFFVRLAQSAHLHLGLFSILGEEIQSWDWDAAAGETRLSWNLDNRGGSGVASGLYLYALSAQEGSATQTQTGKIVVLH